MLELDIRFRCAVESCVLGWDRSVRELLDSIRLDSWNNGDRGVQRGLWQDERDGRWL